MEYNDIVQQFQHNVFGNLTTIRSSKDKNKIWFIGKEVQEFLGHTNITQAIKNANVNSDETFILTKSKNPRFWDDFVTKQYLGAKIRNITFISESGLYKLIMRSNKPEAQKFADWVTSEILPNLRQGVEEHLIMKQLTIDIGKHIDEQNQREESKKINRKNMSEGGKTQTVKYNIKNCVDHDELGRTPRQVKKWGEEIGMLSSERTSAKEVLRIHNKPVACAMSLHDNLITDGVDYDKALKISNGAGKDLFKELIAIGYKPKELNQ